MTHYPIRQHAFRVREIAFLENKAKIEATIKRRKNRVREVYAWTHVGEGVHACVRVCVYACVRVCVHLVTCGPLAMAERRLPPGHA